MSASRRAVGVLATLLSSAEGLGHKLEVGAAIARSLRTRLEFGRGALHVRRPIVMHRDGVRYHVPAGDNSFASATPGVDHSPVVRELAHLLATRSERVCVDVGANLGFVTMALARRFPSHRFVAIEPVPWLADALRRTAALNGFEHVTVLDRAVASRASVDLAIPILQGVYFTTLSSSEREASAEARDVPKRIVGVAAAPLDALLVERGIAFDDVACVKIDVEGAEVEALGTAPRLLANRPPVLFEAFDPRRLFEVSNLLRPFGYQRIRPLDAKNYAATAA